MSRSIARPTESSSPEFTRPLGLIEKLRIVYLPFLIVSAAFLLGYSFLNWLLLVKLELVPIGQEIVGFWIPMILSYCLVHLFLRRRINLLHFKRDKTFGYRMFAWVALWFPVIIAQYFVTAAAGNLTKLDHVSEIDALPRTKYYAITNYWPDRARTSMHVEVTPLRREYSVHVYCVAPLEDHLNDLPSSAPKVWLGMRFQRNISDRIFDDRKEQDRQYRTFLAEAPQDFTRADLSRISYFERVGYGEDGAAFEAAIHENKEFRDVMSPLVLEPSTGSFAARADESRNGTLGTFTVGAVVWFLMLIPPTLDEQKVRRFRAGKPEASDDLSVWTLIMTPGLRITALIGSLNVLIFALMAMTAHRLMSLPPAVLLAWGAQHQSLQTGQWYRLLTSMFLHGGLLHLLLNLYGLVFAGLFLESTLGRIKFLTLYLVAGFCGNILSAWWHPNIISIGASGAIFGVFGAILVLLFYRDHGPNNNLSGFLHMAFFVGANLLISGLSANVDNAAHVGGLLAGTILGGIFILQLPRQPVVSHAKAISPRR